MLAQQQGSPLSPIDSTCAVSELRLTGGIQDRTWERPRLAILWWHQRIGEPDEFMKVAYDAPLTNETEIAIALSDVEPPYEENLICERECRDRQRCPCLRVPALALASIVVAQDTNGDDILSLQEIRAEQVAGVRDVLVGWSAAALGDTPRGWSGYVESTEEGMCPYLYGESNGTESELAPMSSAQAFEFGACPAGATECTFDVPELFCLWERCEAERGLNRLGLGAVLP